MRCMRKACTYSAALKKSLEGLYKLPSSESVCPTLCRCFRSPPRVPSDQHDFQNPHLSATLPLMFVFLSSYLGSHRTCHYFTSHTLILTIPECFGNSDTTDLRLRLTPDSTSAFVNFAGCISGGGDARSRTRTENRSSAVTHAYVNARSKNALKMKNVFFFPPERQNV
jgi:hypothetical protein